MSWLRDGFDFLKEHLRPEVVKSAEGVRMFSPKQFTEIKPAPDPLKDSFKVTTLTALRDLIKCNAEELTGSKTPLIHIVDHSDVRLEVGVSDEHGRRQVFAKASPVAYEGFKFNSEMPVEAFIIGIQAHFAHTSDREYLVKTASRVTDEGVTLAEDDGVSQTVTVKENLALKGNEKLKARVTLKPFRIFPECDQPESEFLFRARKTDRGIVLALYEADGGRWKVTAIEKIEKHLRGGLKIDLPVIA